MKGILILFISVILFSTCAIAQDKGLPKITDSTHIAIVKLKDGTTIKGKVTVIDEKSITIISALGTNTIDRNKISEFSNLPLNVMHDGEYWFPNPNVTRMVFSPTAYMLKPGEGYFQDIALFFISANVGVTENFSIGAMGLIPIVPSFNVLVLTPKAGVEISKDVHAAIGGFFGIAKVDNTPGIGFGLGYGVLTLGSPDANATIGLGYAYAAGEMSKKPTILFGGSFRVTKGFGFVSENYLFLVEKDVTPFISGGVRFFGEHMTFDLGLWNIPELARESGIIGIPYATFVVKF